MIGLESSQAKRRIFMPRANRNKHISDTFTLSHAFVGQINEIASIRERNKEAQNEGAIMLSLIS